MPTKWQNRRLWFVMLLMATIAQAGWRDKLTWTKDYQDCEGKPLDLLLTANPFSYPPYDRIGFDGIEDHEPLLSQLRAIPEQYPNCKITSPILFILAVLQRDSALKHNTSIMSAVQSFKIIATKYPKEKLPFNIGEFGAETLLGPNSLMAIADLRTEDRELILKQILNRFSDENDGKSHTFGANASASLLMLYYSVNEIERARDIARIMLTKYPNQEYRSEYECGMTHSLALSTLARMEPDKSKAIQYSIEILRHYSDDYSGLCESDGGWMGNGAFSFIEGNCGSPDQCVTLLRSISKDSSIGKEYRVLAQLRVAEYFEMEFSDCKKAIIEYKVLIKEFGDQVDYDEDTDTSTSYTQIAQEKISKCEASLASKSTSSNNPANK